LKDKHPSVGDVRGIGVFWAIELVKDRAPREPLVPFNAAGEANAPMVELIGACKARGLWPFTHFNRMHVVPPLTTTDEEMLSGHRHHRRGVGTGRQALHRQVIGRVQPAVRG